MGLEARTTTEKPSDAEIADAANILYQIERGYRDKTELTDAESLLKRAGKEAVRDVVRGKEEKINSQFWATEEEVVTAKILISQQLRLNLRDVRLKVVSPPIGSDIKDAAMLNLDKYPDLDAEGVFRLTKDLFQQVLDELRTEFGIPWPK